MFVGKNQTKDVNMTYNKPEVVKLAVSINAIQGFGNKPNDIHLDKDSTSQYFRQLVATTMAYEADE